MEDWWWLPYVIGYICMSITIGMMHVVRNKQLKEYEKRGMKIQYLFGCNSYKEEYNMVEMICYFHIIFIPLYLIYSFFSWFTSYMAVILSRKKIQEHEAEKELKMEYEKARKFLKDAGKLKIQQKFEDKLGVKETISKNHDDFGHYIGPKG